ncbi:MAG: hypothetical protein MKZ81_00370 [Dehalococcoidia bacterium]|nr:hypothetical protein [Dehalococcoidia bacterium]
MGLGLAFIIILLMTSIVGFAVVQAMFAAKKWRSVIAAGDYQALLQLLDMTFDEWRNSRPPRRTPPSDWRALHSVTLVAANHKYIRVSLLADADVQVVDGTRKEISNQYVVARRAAVRMVERLLYEVPHVKFDAVQVDICSEYRTASGETKQQNLLTTHVNRSVAALSDWDYGSPEDMLLEWETQDGERDLNINPDRDALID